MSKAKWLVAGERMTSREVLELHMEGKQTADKVERWLFGWLYQ
jgi:hypothetical protein